MIASAGRGKNDEIAPVQKLGGDGHREKEQQQSDAFHCQFLVSVQPSDAQLCAYCTCSAAESLHGRETGKACARAGRLQQMQTETDKASALETSSDRLGKRASHWSGSDSST
ncbi:MAG: hypothetical protein V9H26_03440 [Verrucomicrobiota bacterium]